MTITEFLLARIAEDEAVAREIDEAAWSYDIAANREVWADRDRVSVGVGRVLAECEAKRRIVNTRPIEVLSENPQAWRLHDHVLRLLALPYADHPDFDPVWRVAD